MIIMRMMMRATRAKVASTVRINGHVSSVNVFKLLTKKKSDYITDFNLSNCRTEDKTALYLLTLD